MPALLLAGACRVQPLGDEGERPGGLGLLEILGAEVGNLEKEERDLKRKLARLERVVGELRAEEQRMAGLESGYRRQIGRRRELLAERLATLRFLEESLETAEKRAREVERQLQSKQAKPPAPQGGRPAAPGRKGRVPESKPAGKPSPGEVLGGKKTRPR